MDQGAYTLMHASATGPRGRLPKRCCRILSNAWVAMAASPPLELRMQGRPGKNRAVLG